MKYIDRKGNIIIESTGQDRLLRLLYDSGACKSAYIKSRRSIPVIAFFRRND